MSQMKNSPEMVVSLYCEGLSISQLVGRVKFDCKSKKEAREYVEQCIYLYHMSLKKKCTKDCIHCEHLKANYVASGLRDRINVCLLTGEVVMEGTAFMEGWNSGELPF